MKRKLMFFMTFLFLGIGLVTAQTSRVTGVVTAEEDGLPVVGASVLVNGTTLGTITDIDGKFTITNVPSSSKTYLYFKASLFPPFLFYLIVNQNISASFRNLASRLTYYNRNLFPFFFDLSHLFRAGTWLVFRGRMLRFYLYLRLSMSDRGRPVFSAMS